jgi:hypothetical protein
VTLMEPLLLWTLGGTRTITGFCESCEILDGGLDGGLGGGPCEGLGEGLDLRVLRWVNRCGKMHSNNGRR